ncbi:MAG: AEC family transporter [Gordonia sp. (in: high G+C Gram-positive bacteria)]
MSGVISGFTVIFIMVAIGFVLGRTGALGEHAHEVLSRLVFFVCTPALLFHSLVTTDLSVIFSSTLLIAGGSALAVGTGYLVIGRWWLPGRRELPELVIGALSSSYVNSVNLGLPIAIFVLDDASFIAPLLLFQILVYSPMALVALDLTALTGDRDTTTPMQPLRDAVVLPLTNPIVIGGLIGVACSALRLAPPAAVLEPMKMLGNASVPLALLAFGLSLTGVAVFTKGQSPRRDIALAAVLKILVMPALVYVIARFGVGQTGHQLFAQVVIAALPTAQNVLVYATRYRRGQILARDTALITTLASIPAIAVIALVLA